MSTILKLSKAQTNNTLSSKVLQEIKEDIVYGKIPQGKKIVETELAKIYNISRGPLREALHSLEYINLVERTPHSGSTVITLSEEKIKEIYQVREALEGMAVRLASTKMNDAEINYLYELLKEQENSIKKSQDKVYFQKEGDMDFHYYIYSKCGNSFLIDYLHNKLYQVLRMCRQKTSQLPYRPEIALREHRNIVDAINNKDEELAEILMRRHIKGAWQEYKKLSFIGKIK